MQPPRRRTMHDVPTDILDPMVLPDGVPEQPEEAPSPPVPPRPVSHLTVVELVHWYSTGEPVCVESRFARPLSSMEEPYRRRLAIGPEWKLLDSGWITTAGMLVLTNTEGMTLQRNPSPDELGDIQGRVIEIKFGQDGIPAVIIPPGESSRFHPAACEMYLRCRSGNAEGILYLFPN